MINSVLLVVFELIFMETVNIVSIVEGWRI